MRDSWTVFVQMFIELTDAHSYVQVWSILGGICSSNHHRLIWSSCWWCPWVLLAFAPYLVEAICVPVDKHLALNCVRSSTTVLGKMTRALTYSPLMTVADLPQFHENTQCCTRSRGPGHIVGFRRVKVPSVRSIMYSTTWWWVKDRGLNMGDSIGDLIVTPHITNLSGKDTNRCQMRWMFFWPDMLLLYVLSFVRRS